MLQAYQELATILLNYHFGRIVLGRCVLEFRCGWIGVVSVLQANVVIQQNSRKVLMMDILMPETC